MYQQNTDTGAKWFFWLVIVILAIVFALGFNIKDAKWLNGNIASATAEQMGLTTDIERQKAGLDLLILKQRTEIQVAQEKQQAEYEAAQQRQRLESQTVAAIQFAGFRQDLYKKISDGLLALLVAASVSIAAWGIGSSIASYKLAVGKAQLAQSVQPMLKRSHRQPSPAALQAREREQKNRFMRITVKDAQAIWPDDDGKTQEFISGNYPWAS